MGSSNYKGNNYPDCVETALLLFVRCLFYNIAIKGYDMSLLNLYPTINLELKCIIMKLTSENENSEYIKNMFSSIVSNIPKVKYIHVNYEVMSSLENVLIILDYLFNSEENVKGVIQSTATTGIVKIDFDDVDTITINYINNRKLILKFSLGHASIGYLNKSIEMYKYKNLVLLLTNKYYIYDELHFNIYNTFLKSYIDKNILVIPKYLNFLMLSEKIYFIGDGNWDEDNVIGNDFNLIVYKNNAILKYIIQMDEQDIINIIIKSGLLKTIVKDFNARKNLKGSKQKLPKEVQKFLQRIYNYKIPNTLFEYINETYFKKTSTFNAVYTIDDFMNQLDCVMMSSFTEEQMEELMKGTP